MFHLHVKTPDGEEVHILTSGTIALKNAVISMDGAAEVTANPLEPAWHVEAAFDDVDMFPLLAVASHLVNYMIDNAAEYQAPLLNWHKRIEASVLATRPESDPGHVPASGGSRKYPTHDSPYVEAFNRTGVARMTDGDQ